MDLCEECREKLKGMGIPTDSVRDLWEMVRDIATAKRDALEA
jgi:hypothetical protein